MSESLHPPEYPDRNAGSESTEAGGDTEAKLHRIKELEQKLRALLIPKAHERSLRRLFELRKKGTSRGYDDEELREFLHLQDQLLDTTDAFADLRALEVAMVLLAI